MNELIAKIKELNEAFFTIFQQLILVYRVFQSITGNIKTPS